MGQPYENLRKLGDWSSRFLDTVGDGSGSIEANVNGLITPVDFHYTVPAGHIALVDRLIIFVQDTGALDAGKYGNGLALSNGIIGGKTDENNVWVPRTTQLPVKTNGDWGSYAFDIEAHKFGTGDEVFIARYSYVKDGAPLKFTENTKYTIRVADDLTGLNKHRFRVGVTLIKL